MPIKTEKDLWVEMSIREIWTRAHFAGLAFSNINPTDNDATFSSIHAFLSQCAMTSKLLRGSYDTLPRSKLQKLLYCLLVYIGLRIMPVTVGSVLGIADSSTIHNRQIRNNLEHYDERLKKWIK